MMRPYTGKKKSSGSWHEGLDGSFAVFETHSRMCKLIHDEMLEEIPIRLQDGAPRTYLERSGQCETYLEAVEWMRS